MTREELLAALARVEQERDELFATLVAMEVAENAPHPEDRLLTVGETAALLATSTDWLYRHADHLPFTVRTARGQVRFSKNGIQDYLRKARGARS